MRRRSSDVIGDEPRATIMPLRRTRWAIAGMVLGGVGVSWFGVSHRSPDAVAPADGSDASIDGAVRTVSRGVQSVSANVIDGLERARTSSRNQALESKVRSRLSQDKALDADRIEVSVEDGGTVILKGLVADAESKEVAVDLTRNLRGVQRIMDHLAVEPRPRVFASRPTDDDAATGTRSRRSR
jgi:hypothetical protein